MKFKSLQKYFFFLIIALSSCGESSTINRPDVSDIKVDIVIDRFDKKLSSLKKDDIIAQNTFWQSEYPFFYKDYMTEMLEVGNPKDSIYVQEVLSQVLEKRDFIDLSKAVNKKFPDLKLQEQELTKAFKYIKYYYPDYTIPKFISFIGGFSFQTPIGEDYIGIGLDMFLGKDSEFYPALVASIPLYISQRFTPENIVPRVVEAVLREELYPQNEIAQNTLEYMIYNGKILYAMDVLLESTSDEIKIGYTEKQMKWVRQHQTEIWAWFVNEDLLFSTDYNRIQKYFTEAPFTPELGDKGESAPKLGSYLGWMMVRKFMAKKPEISVKELFETIDAQRILEDSKFKG